MSTEQDRLVTGAGTPPATHATSTGTASTGAAGAPRGAPLPADAGCIELLGVGYAHLKTRDGGDLYLTKHGQPFWEHLLPENWYARDWFEANRERLVGTSTVYKVPTRKVRGTRLHLVVKWSRVGEDVPLDTMTITKFINAEF